MISFGNNIRGEALSDPGCRCSTGGQIEGDGKEVVGLAIPSVAVAAPNIGSTSGIEERSVECGFDVVCLGSESGYIGGSAQYACYIPRGRQNAVPTPSQEQRKV